MIRKLEENIIGKGEVKGFIYQCIVSIHGVYMYEVYKDSTLSHYEVFKAKLAYICLDFANRIYSDTEQKEIYPKSKDFGVTAWTFLNEIEAEQKFNSLAITEELYTTRGRL